MPGRAFRCGIPGSRSSTYWISSEPRRPFRDAPAAATRVGAIEGDGGPQSALGLRRREWTPSGLVLTQAALDAGIGDEPDQGHRHVECLGQPFLDE
jgi:hypothetical protein